MLHTALIEIFERDLHKLATEISLYSNEQNLWIIKPDISNSAGNLCLHLLGNLNHFVGAVLGQNGYVRKRDEEFALKDVPRSQLIAHIETTTKVVLGTIAKLLDEDFNRNFPVEKHGSIVKTDFMLLHLLTHFNYHLGQINYHRRLIDDAVGAN